MNTTSTPNLQDTRRQALQALSLPLITPWAALAQPTGLPIEQVKIVNGFPAGGTADATSRRIGDKLAGTPFSKNAAVVENKTGAAGRIAIDNVKNSPADGSSLLLTPCSMMAIYPHIYKTLSYDPFKDFAPVCMASSMVHGLAVGPMVPASVKTVQDFLAWCKANPKLANYGSPAAGSTPHFLAALLSLDTGVEMQHIPYRGSVPGVTDLIGGQLAGMFTPHGDFLANHRAGKIRILATSGRKRSPFVPDVATFAEQGFSGLTVEEWFGFFAPAKTPANIVSAANAAINLAIKDKGVIDAWAVQGLVPLGSGVDEMAKDLRRQFEYWGPIVKRIGFTAES